MKLLPGVGFQLMRYGIALLAVTLALLIKLILNILTGGKETPFLILFSAILVGTWYGGTKLGLWSAVLEAFAKAKKYAEAGRPSENSVLETQLSSAVSNAPQMFLRTPDKSRDRSWKQMLSDRGFLPPTPTASGDELHQLNFHLENSPLAIIEWDSNFRVVRWSRKAEALFGWQSAEVTGKHPQEWQFIYAEDVAAVNDEIGRLLKGSEARSVSQNRNYTKDGSIVYCEWYNSALLDESGRLVSVLSLVLDVTSRQRTEAALRESEERFRTMADSAPVLLWVAGMDGRCNFFNQRWLTFRGHTLEEELDKGWAEGLHPEDLQRCSDTYLAAFHARENFQMEYRLLRADGEYRWLLDRGAPRFLADGSFAGYIGSCIDITERKTAEAALRDRAAELARLSSIFAKTNAALEKRNAELDHFAYIVSHDLKAPLRAISNLSTWIEEDLLDLLNPETQRNMNLLRGRVHRMEALINGLLQYSRVGRVKTVVDLVDVDTLLAEIVSSLAPPPTFTITIQPGMPTFLTERLPLEQVFANLLSNCFKHHPRSDGTATISVQDKEAFYEFAVADDGCGIAPQYHDKIFVMFQTLEARDKVENTGVGLAIVKKIIENKGGTIRLKSQLNQGSTFYFTWPKQPTSSN
ncbi:MAG: PAS domain S-box protein [Cyanobacteriota bacterium]